MASRLINSAVKEFTWCMHQVMAYTGQVVDEMCCA
jgi:hypothetical protein